MKQKLKMIEERLSSLDSDFDNKKIEQEEYMRRRSFLINKKNGILTRLKIKK